MPIPHAKPVYFSGSYPTASNTAECTIPQPRISIQPLFLHIEQPSPPHAQQLMSTSALGSVYGKKLGRNRSRELPPNISRANASSVPLRSASEIPSPTTSPSSCVKFGVCVRSRSSLRYTLPGTTIRTGG